MRYLYLALISAILFESCSVTKRRYLPGFSVNWNHKAPNTVTPKNLFTSKVATNRNSIKTIVTKQLTIAVTSPLNNFKLKNGFVNFPFYHSNKIRAGRVFQSKSEPVISQSNGESPANAPSNDGSGKETCKQSKVSMHSGMYALTLTLSSTVIWLMLIVLKNIGMAWATASLAGAVLIGGVVSGGSLGVLAIVFGVIALHKINKDKELLTGKKKAVTGIVFATILFGILTLMVA